MKKNTIFYLMGAFIFAFLLGELVHEYGHYLWHVIFGHEGVSVIIDPFGGSKNTGVTAMPMSQVAVTTIMGPMTNVILATATYFIFKKTDFLPITIWMPVALLQEGVTFSLGSLTDGGDAQWIATSTGIPLALIIAFGIILLCLGIWRLAYEVSRMKVIKEASFGGRFLILLISMGTLMLIRSLYSFVLDSSLIVENLVPLLFSLIVAMLVTALINKKTPEKDLEVSTAYYALAMGVLMFVFQMII